MSCGVTQRNARRSHRSTVATHCPKIATSSPCDDVNVRAKEHAMSQQHAKKAIQAWFDGPEVAEIDRWRREQIEIPPLAEAMRVLVRRGLAASDTDEEQEHA